MPAPKPHEGPCKRTGDGAEHDDDVTKLGRYRGLCGICRPIIAAEQTGRGAHPRDDGDPIAAELRDRARQPKLSRVCRDLAVKADKLEKALNERKAATTHAQGVLREFKETLTLVGRVAQSLVNQSGTAARDDE